MNGPAVCPCPLEAVTVKFGSAAGSDPVCAWYIEIADAIERKSARTFATRAPA